MLQFVWLQKAFTATRENESPADEDAFSFSKVALEDYRDEDDSSTSGSTVSSMTLSACSGWGEEEELQVVEEQANDAMPQVSCEFTETHPLFCSSASLPERKAPTQLNRPSHRRRHSDPVPVCEAVTLSELQANIDKLTAEYGNDHALVAQTWNLIGNVHYREHDYKSALHAYKESVLCCDTGPHLADAYANIGKTYLSLENIEDSIDFLHRGLEAHELFALTLDRDLRTNLQFAEAHYNLGLALTEKGDFDCAFVHLHKSRAIRERVVTAEDYQEGIAKTLNAIGTICLLEEDPGCALRCHMEALHFLDQLDSCHHEILVKTLCCIAAAHRANDDMAIAISTYERAIEKQKTRLLKTDSNAIRKDLSTSLVSLADLLVENKQELSAREAYIEAKRLNKTAGLESIHPLQRSLRTKIFQLS